MVETVWLPIFPAIAPKRGGPNDASRPAQRSSVVRRRRLPALKEFVMVPLRNGSWLGASTKQTVSPTLYLLKKYSRIIFKYLP
jgi:hypothetical protein